MTSTKDTPQLPLGLTVRDNARFDNFIAEHNDIVCDLLQACVKHRAESFVYLWGDSGSGRSHLLQATCHAAAVSGQKPLYLPMKKLMAQMRPEVLMGVEDSDVICIDSIEALVGNKEWQEATFHLFNRIIQHNRLLVIAGNAEPYSLGIELKDLVTRLNSGVAHWIHRLSKEDVQRVIKNRIIARGMRIDDPVVEYITDHASLDLRDVTKLIETLDQKSLAEKARLTKTFVKRVLHEAQTA
ncbi:MAG: DnaA regulatory inactivator Hda [Pontibacterium sp.]